MDKLAVAVYSPTDPVGSALQDAYHAASGRYLTMGETQRVLRAALYYRGLSQKLRQSPGHVAKLLFGERNTSGMWFYPCDTVELREMFARDRLGWHAPVLLMNLKAATKLAPEYPLMLAFERDVSSLGDTLGGALLIDGNRLPLASSLRRVMVREHLNDAQVREVYRSLAEASNGEVPVYLATQLPGLASAYEKKVAASGDADPLERLRPKLRAWFAEYNPIDSGVFMTPDGTRVMLSLGDAEGNYEAHKRSLQEALGHDVEVEVCDECGAPPGHIKIKGRGGAFAAATPGDTMDKRAASNWYERAKGPADTFGKEFTVGRQPQAADPDQLKVDYVAPEEAISLRPGDRVAYRYTDVKLPVHNESASLPFTRSLVQRPKLGTVQKIDRGHIHVLWDGAKEPQKVPLDQDVFLVKVTE